MIRRIEALNADIEQTLERTRAARERLNDPAWIESIREPVVCIFVLSNADGVSALDQGESFTIDD